MVIIFKDETTDNITNQDNLIAHEPQMLSNEHKNNYRKQKHIKIKQYIWTGRIETFKLVQGLSSPVLSFIKNSKLRLDKFYGELKQTH